MGAFFYTLFTTCKPPPPPQPPHTPNEQVGEVWGWLTSCEHGIFFMLARYATNQNLYKPRVRTNNGKQMFSFRTTDVWKSIPQTFRELNEYAFFFKKKNRTLSTVRAIIVETSPYLFLPKLPSSKTCPYYFFEIFRILL